MTMTATLPQAVETTDAFPSGTWNLGPVSVTWNLKAGNEVDVTVAVLGIQIDTLTASIKSGTVAVADEINVLGIVRGRLELDGKPDGLYISGRLTGPGFDFPFNHRLIAW